MKTKALCIFSTILGNSTVTSRLQDALARLSDVEPVYVLLGPDDYVKYRAPFWARAAGPWEAEFVARQKAGSALNAGFDILLVGTWEMAVAFGRVLNSAPAAAIIDATPRSMHAQVQQRGVTGLKRWLADQAHHRAFAAVADRIDYYLPRTSDCADSLRLDYGIDRERCFITLAAQKLDVWKPSKANGDTPRQLLFVGNDFSRKGGDFLLRLYEDHLRGACTLTIASNDRALEGRRLPPGVEWIRGRSRSELLPIFQRSDLFILPTSQDFAPEVVAEALATGLPCFVTDVPGMRELVSDGDTGFRMPRDAAPESWAAPMLRVLQDSSELLRMSANARCFAEETLDFEQFVRLMAEVVDRLRAAIPKR